MAKEYVTKDEFENRIAKVLIEVRSILSRICIDNDNPKRSSEILIQRKISSVGNATAITFDTPFKAGTVPTVTGNVVAAGSDCYFSPEPTPTNTGFAGTVKDSAGNFQTLNVNWMAVGEKA
jgi:hypothetical protein